MYIYIYNIHHMVQKKIKKDGRKQIYVNYRHPIKGKFQNKNNSQIPRHWLNRGGVRFSQCLNIREHSYFETLPTESSFLPFCRKCVRYIVLCSIFS